jgi:hypothetical protein
VFWEGGSVRDNINFEFTLASLPHSSCPLALAMHALNSTHALDAIHSREKNKEINVYLGWRYSQTLTFPPGKVQLLLFFLLALALVKLNLSSLAFLGHHGVVSRGEKTSKRLLPPPPDWFILQPV